MAAIEVRLLAQGRPFGIRIGGKTRAVLEDAGTRREIDDLFVQHGMIVVEDVEQTDAMQLAISSCFCPLKEHPLLAAARMPETVRKIAIWWISGGPVGLAGLAWFYCGDQIAAASKGGMEAVA